MGQKQRLSDLHPPKCIEDTRSFALSQVNLQVIAGATESGPLISIDFWEQGDTLEVIDILNGLN